MLRLLFGFGGLGTAAVCGVVYQRQWEGGGLRRAAQFYCTLAPIALHYRLLDLSQRWTQRLFGWEPQAQAWEDLHDKYNEQVLGDFLALRGFYIKLGQVPEVYLEQFRKLEDRCPAEEGSVVQKIVAEDLGVSDIGEIFKSFDPTPIGAASIGQVHRAVLKDGTPVCVKVQYPGVETLFRSDIDTCRFFCRFVAPEQLLVFDEIQQQFMAEFNYRVEAEQLEQALRNMQPFAAEVHVPKPFMDLCTRNVLVMEFIEGPKLRDGIRNYARKWAARQGKTLEQLSLEMRQEFELNGLPPPYTGPSARTIETYRWVWRSITYMVNFPIALCNKVTNLLGKTSQFRLFDFEIPLNGSMIMGTLGKITAHQIFVDGFVNADPHGGNFLLMPDGRIGLIDFGQVKKLTLKERLYLAKMFVAMAEQNKPRLKELAIQGGFKSKYYDEDVIWNMCLFALDRDGRDLTGGLNIQQFMDQQYERDPWERVNSAIIMPSRVSILLRGIGLMLNHPVSVTRAWLPAAEELLRQHGLTYLSEDSEDGAAA